MSSGRAAPTLLQRMRSKEGIRLVMGVALSGALLIVALSSFISVAAPIEREEIRQEARQAKKQRDTEAVPYIGKMGTTQGEYFLGMVISLTLLIVTVPVWKGPVRSRWVSPRTKWTRFAVGAMLSVPLVEVMDPFIYGVVGLLLGV